MKTFVPDTADKPVDTRSEARAAFDTAHGKITGMITNAESGNATNLDIARAHLDATVQAYGTMSIEERRSTSTTLAGLLERAAQSGIQPSTKPRVAAPAVEQQRTTAPS